MKFSANSKSFVNELDAVKKTIANKATIPVLENVLITAHSSGLVTLTGTDLDQTVISRIKCDVSEIGSTCVNAKTLNDMLKPLAGDLAFELVDDKLTVVSGRINSKFETVNPDNFPLIPEVTGTDAAIVSNEHFQSMIKNTLFAATKEMSRFTLAGVKCELLNGHLRMISTDGHRLAYADSNSVQGALSWDKESHVIIRTETLKIAGLLTGESISITDAPDHVKLNSDNRTIISRKVPGKFPNYDLVIPEKFEHTATFNVASLRDAVKRASVSSNDKKTVKIELDGSTVTLETSKSSECTRSESVDIISYTGEKTAFSFNWSYLLDWLTVTKTDTATLSMNDINAQVQLSPVEYDYDVKYIVMPFRT